MRWIARVLDIGHAVVGRIDSSLPVPRNGVTDSDRRSGNGRTGLGLELRGLDFQPADGFRRADDHLAGKGAVPRPDNANRVERLGPAGEVQVEIRRQDVALPDLEPLRPHRVRHHPCPAGRSQANRGELARVEAQVVLTRLPSTRFQLLLVHDLVIRGADDLNAHDVESLAKQPLRNRNIGQCAIAKFKPPRRLRVRLIGGFPAAQPLAVPGQVRLCRITLRKCLLGRDPLGQVAPGDLLSVEVGNHPALVGQRQRKPLDLRRIGHHELATHAEPGQKRCANGDARRPAKPRAVVELHLRPIGPRRRGLPVQPLLL